MQRQQPALIKGGPLYPAGLQRQIDLRAQLAVHKRRCCHLIGEPKFEELYSYLKSMDSRDDDDSQAAEHTEQPSAASLSKGVYDIVPQSKAEAVLIMYKLLYTEAKLELAEGQT